MGQRIRLIHGDCLEQLRTLADNSVHAVVTDPPYGLSFMGKKWDYDVPSEDVWRECLRVLKPGGHLLAFAGTRTQHRMAMRIEDAGFEIRDMIAWVYGTGFPKSLDVSKAIDKAAGAEREVVGQGRFAARRPRPGAGDTIHMPAGDPLTAPATEAAKHWQGWGTALKPALEPITVARKPLIGTVAENVLTHGTGAINVDGGRVGTESTIRPMGGKATNRTTFGTFAHDDAERMTGGSDSGRWPANLIHDGSEEVVGLFPETGAAKASDRGAGKGETVCFGVYGGSPGVRGHNDAGGSAARFFYCAKASKADRDEGCEGMVLRFAPTMGNGIGGKEHDPETATPKRNHHPTVKPTELMRYLVKLVTPPDGIVLDPFMGSGSTGKACAIEGFQFIGIEREEEYIEIARARIAAASNLFSCQ